MQELESEERNVTFPSGGRSKTLNRPHFGVALAALEIAASHARHSLGEEPSSVSAVSFRYFPRMSSFKQASSPRASPGAGIARARRFKAANIKVNATPVISAAFKAGTQTHARSL